MRVLVGTNDYEGSSAFYEDVLGFPIAETWDDPDGRGTLFKATDGAVIELVEDSPHHPYEPPRGVTVAIEVPDVDALHGRVTAAGIIPTEALGNRPWGHRNFAIDDPSGLPLVFFSPLPTEERAE